MPKTTHSIIGHLKVVREVDLGIVLEMSINLGGCADEGRRPTCYSFDEKIRLMNSAPEGAAAAEEICYFWLQARRSRHEAPK
jgi:hypothetical protein